MVARFGETKREQLAHSVKNLEDVGASLLGVVFTMLPPRAEGSYGYRYNYYGSYGTPSKPAGA
jgi:receptor protein-tyrosine kinase